MEKLSLIFKLIPFVALLCFGIFSVLEVFFPSLRSSDFNRWEVDDDSGSYVQVMGWKKILTPPRVLAQGFMSDRAACALASVVGSICILIAVLGIRHVSGLPKALPDLFERF